MSGSKHAWVWLVSLVSLAKPRLDMNSAFQKMWLITINQWFNKRDNYFGPVSSFEVSCFKLILIKIRWGAPFCNLIFTLESQSCISLFNQLNSKYFFSKLQIHKCVLHIYEDVLTPSGLSLYHSYSLGRLDLIQAEMYIGTPCEGCQPETDSRQQW